MDLSVGTPVNPVPPVVADALRAAANSPGYPATHGTAALRQAAAGWLARRHGVTVPPESVLPLIGTKEFIAGLPTLLGCGRGDVVVYPELAYPTYDVGARLAGAQGIAADGLTTLGPERVRLAWVNSPGNPTGRVLPPAHLAKMVSWARERGAVLASDECYLGLGWTSQPVSILHPDCPGLPPRASSRCTRCPSGRTWPATGPGSSPATRTSSAAAGGPQARRDDDAGAGSGRDGRRAGRRRARRPAARGIRRAARPAAARLPGGRLEISHSEAGLYLWARRSGHDGWGAVELLAGLGILVAPGEFYGPAGGRTSGSRSPPPTSASTPPSSAWPPCRNPVAQLLTRWKAGTRLRP